MLADAPTAAATDWRQVLNLYDDLMVITPNPVLALNRAVAVAEVEGPAAAIRSSVCTAPSRTLWRSTRGDQRTDSSAARSATSRGSPVSAVPIRLVT